MQVPASTPANAPPGRFDHRRYRPAPGLNLPERQWPSRRISAAPTWVSVDLRDGNQALREPMSVTQKQRFWSLLVALGFTEIEVGFPAASQPDHDFVRWLIESDAIPSQVSIQVLVQAREDLIERTFAALQGVPRAIVHLYNATSPVQRERVFGLDRAGVTALARQGAEWVQQAAARAPQTDWTFQYSPESFTATEPDFAVAICQAVLDVWKPTPARPAIVNLPATVELASPNVFADQVEFFATHIGCREAIRLSVHTHNDRGGAVAAAELALLAGADRVEGTLFGNGERTGNADLLTLAMNLYSQGIDPGLHLSDPESIMQVYRDCTGLPVHPRHPWVGELVYTAFSGSHQDAIRKCLAVQGADEPWAVPYLPIDPRDLGRSYQAVIRVNSQSGKGGVAFVLERDYGLVLPRWLQVALARSVQQLAEQRGGELDAAELHALFARDFMAGEGGWRLQGYRLERNGQDQLLARLCDPDGRERVLQGSGGGALEAFVDALTRWCGEAPRIIDYQEHALGAGTEAQAAAYVQLELGDATLLGAAIDRDSVAAALKAVLAAVNRCPVGAAVVDVSQLTAAVAATDR